MTDMSYLVLENAKTQVVSHKGGILVVLCKLGRIDFIKDERPDAHEIIDALLEIYGQDPNTQYVSAGIHVTNDLGGSIAEDIGVVTSEDSDAVLMLTEVTEDGLAVTGPFKTVEDARGFHAALAMLRGDDDPRWNIVEMADGEPAICYWESMDVYMAALEGYLG